MDYHIFDFYPLEIKKIKYMDKSTKKYKKELHKCMFGIKHINWLGYLRHDKVNLRFKERYNKYFIPTIVFSLLFIFWAFYGIHVSNQWEETEFILPWELRLLIIWSIVWIIIFTIAMIYALKARKVIFDYLSFLVDNYSFRKHNLTDKELALVIKVFKTPHEHYDNSYGAISAGCLDCLKIFDAKSFTNGSYHNYECPYCKSDKLICKIVEDNFKLDEKLLKQINEYWR